MNIQEDREREALRRQGVDLSGLPRRTSNVIERFQDTFRALEEATRSKGGGPGDFADEPQLGEVEAEEEGSGKRARPGERPSKRQLLEARATKELEQVIQVMEAGLGPGVDSRSLGPRRP